MAARYVNNNDGTFTLVRDDGHKQSFIDPDGSFRAELDKMSTGTGEIAGAKGDASSKPMSSLAGNSLAMPAPAPTPSLAPALNAQVFSPDAIIPPAAAQQLQDQQRSVDHETQVMGGGNNANAGVPSPAGAEPMRILVPGSPGESSTTVTTPSGGGSTSKSVTQVDPTGELAAKAAEASEQQGIANAALTEGKRAALENSGTLIMNETLKQNIQEKEQTRIAGIREQAYADALAARKKARETPIDPGQAFGDDGGAAAFAATIGGAIRNIGLAWMGQSAQPINIIDNLVNRSVMLQKEQRQQNIDEASETAETHRAFAAEAKANAYAAAQQQVQLLRQKTDNENAIAMLDPLLADLEAKRAQADAETAQALADKTVIEEQRSWSSGGQSVTTKNGTPDTVIELPPGSDEENAADAVNAAHFDQSASAGEQTKAQELKDSVVAISQRERILEELERLEKGSGAVSDVIGVWKGGRGVLGALPGVSEANFQNPDQRRAKDLLDSLEIANAQESKRESNSVKRQEMQARNMLPQNDRDLPTFFARGKEWVNERKRDQWIGYDPKVVGKVRSELRSGASGKVEEF